jgi:hypothetical protein
MRDLFVTGPGPDNGSSKIRLRTHASPPFTATHVLALLAILPGVTMPTLAQTPIPTIAQASISTEGEASISDFYGIWAHPFYPGPGATVFAHACQLGAEGIVSKKVDGTYCSGPCRVWIKVRNPASIAVQRKRSERWNR